MPKNPVTFVEFFQSFHVVPGQEFTEIEKVDTAGLRVAVGAKVPLIFGTGVGFLIGGIVGLIIGFLMVFLAVRRT